MTKEVRISNYSRADDTDLRTMTVDLGPRKITTPTKAITTKSFYKDTQFPSELSDLNEIFLRFDDKTLISMDEDKSYSMHKNNDVNRSKIKANDCPSLCFVEFKNKGDTKRYPNIHELETLTNVAYTYSDLTPIPSIPKMARTINKENYDEFIQYISSCIDSIEVRNKKSILGYIPSVAALYTRKLVDFYLDHGINAYYIDFDGTMVRSHLDSLNALKKQLAKRGYEENNFLYYTNVSYGKAINDQGVLSARDLVAYGHGLDCLGGIHMGPKRSPEFYEWFKTKKDISRNTNRILNRQDYGYYRIDLAESIPNIYPKDALIESGNVLSELNSRQKRLLQIVNLQQQCKEADNLKIITNESQDTSLDYFRSKKNVIKEDLKSLAKKSGI